LTDLSPAATGIAFRDLECLLALVEERDYARAADRLGMTQSAVARAIRRLESEVHVPLVVRRSAGVAPTDAGQRFADHAGRLIAGLRLATSEARRSAGVPAPVQIGCVPDLPVQHLQSFLGGLYLDQPDLLVDVAHVHTAEQLRALQGGELDLGVIRHARDARGIEVEPLFQGEQLAAFLWIGHRLAPSSSVGPDDLREESLVVPPRTVDPALDDRLKTRLVAGYQFREIRDAPGADARSLLFAVGEHRAIAVAPISLLYAAGDVATLVTARPLRPALLMPDTALAWRADPPPELGKIVAAARAVARRLYRRADTES
jgi:DNA-binding transcriptional LysR family regulator